MAELGFEPVRLPLNTCALKLHVRLPLKMTETGKQGSGTLPEHLRLGGPSLVNSLFIHPFHYLPSTDLGSGQPCLQDTLFAYEASEFQIRKDS